jgi:hypothetical protein
MNVGVPATQTVRAALARDGVYGMVILGTGENNSLNADESRAVRNHEVGIFLY